MMQRLAHIACEYSFEASHQLLRPDWSPEENERVFGRCVRAHGHSYRLIVSLHGPIDPDTGMVLNFSDLDRIVRERIVKRLDHYDLNVVVGGITTAENLVYWILDQLAPHVRSDWLEGIELWETRTNRAFLDRSDIQAYLLERQRAIPSVV